MKLPILSISLIGAILLSSCTTPEKEVSGKDCYPNSTKPTQIITYEEMSVMMETFDSGPKKGLDKYLSKKTNGKDTVSTKYNWYNIDDLKQYIAYIERISKEKDIPLTGFRIYPTTYPENYSKKEYRNRQTLIFTPTTKIGDQDDVAFEPLYSERGKPVQITKFLEQVRAKQVDKASLLPNPLNAQTGLESSSANRIRTYPPPH